MNEPMIRRVGPTRRFAAEDGRLVFPSPAPAAAPGPGRLAPARG